MQEATRKTSLKCGGDMTDTTAEEQKASRVTSEPKSVKAGLVRGAG